MKVLMYDKSAKQEKTVRIALQENTRGVSMVAVDEDGDSIPGGEIVSIDHNGTLVIKRSLSKGLGLVVGQRNGGITVTWE